MIQINNQIEILQDRWDQYALMDCGNRRKLERFGKVILARSEPKAWWPPALPQKEWDKAAAYYYREEQSQWVFNQKIPLEWLLRFEDYTFQARLTENSHHVGVFPEHTNQWRWMKDTMKRAGRPLRVLNLFGYTGAASLIAAAAGSEVTHVDASKGTVTWARTNQQLSKLEKKPIRWIVEDATKFVQREGRRGRKYDAIIMDPPKYGRGPNGEMWKVEQNLPELLHACHEILSEGPEFVLLTMYSIDESSILIGNLLQNLMKDFSGRITLGELALQSQSSPMRLPMSIFGRWTRS